MTIPPNTTIFGPYADPRDVANWRISATGLLEADEWIDTIELVLGAEAVAAGLVIMEDAGREPVVVDDGRAVQIWLSVVEEMQLDPMFDGAGVLLPIEITIETNSIPARTWQRTIAVRVAQQ
ncbi:hypothetical protein HRJ34_00285 [Rhizorhabdus wittichii]|uniref:Uncharacterized protein n=1 Tax=Rhizorhabdus wittichii TaxID=160791 RepID=A0A975HE54_9SPHN|nr:hypothetical protein [Rhizorhabdus wittichii]QTH22017.1 hypothetical protein HRJ34_00285 [Rhizorhabdus wittichii]